jgi:hypothetical protein
VPGDNTAPTATPTVFRHRRHSRVFRFTVTFTDNQSIDTSSLGARDIQVQTNGYARHAVLISVDNAADGKTRTATYAVKGPNGRWDRTDNGIYSIWVVPNQVKDTSGNFIPKQQIGNFAVRIPKHTPATPPQQQKGGTKVKRAFTFD